MKRKYIAILTGVLVGMSVLGGCGTTSTKTTAVSSTEAAASGSEAQSETLVGEVTAVGDDTITVQTGGQQAPGDGEETTESTEDAAETEIQVTADTVVVKQSGGPGGAPPDGNAPDNGSAPSDGNAPDNSNAPLDGNAPDNGNAPTDGNGQGSGSAPEKPDDSNAPSDGNAPQAETEEAEFSDIAVGDRVSITFDADGNAAMITILGAGGPGNGGSGGGASAGVDSYDAVTEFSEDTEEEGKTYTSTGTDENAVHVLNGATVTLKDSTVTRTSSESKGGDNSSFYGVGAALLDTDGTLYVSNADIDTDASGAAGIFAYGDGVVYAADSDIKTTQDTSGGIHAAGGGTLYAWDLNVETNGASAAAIRSDRGGGTMVVDGGSYTSNGTGSPAVYSTADIAVNNADLTANGSEAVCIEGLNSLHLFDTDLTGNMSDDEQNDCTWNVILYQSMSGDSEVGNSTFEMDGGTLTAKNGGMFYTTNTESTFVLSNVDINYADDNAFFLRCTGNNNKRGWGQTGANGADCLFGANDQEMQGDIIWDSISQLDLYMTGSTLTGAVVDDETYAGNGGDGYCNLYIDKDSTWIVTGDSTVSSLSCEGTIRDADGNTVTVKGTDGTIYIEGTSAYTITADSYSDTADMSGAPAESSWSDYEVTRPDNL